MLRQLHIQNLAVIEDATIDLGPGLNAFTGQTGAGKSLIIGAFELLLGLRSGTGMLRGEAEEGRVSGLFEISDQVAAERIAEVLDQPIEPGEQLLVTRKLFASGRTSVSVNGQPATAAMVKNLGQHLVDIHGQHDHQYLLKPAHQLLILDDYAQTHALRKRFAETLAGLRELENRQNELQTSRNLRRQQLELYEFQADEIDKVDPQPQEYPELAAREKVLRNMHKITSDAGQAYAALYDTDGSITERLTALVHVLTDLVELDEGLGDVAEQVRTSTLTLQEAAFELSRYVDRLDHDPAEAAEVADRLNALNRLIQKYAQTTGEQDAIAPVLAYREEIGKEIDRLRSEDDDLANLDERLTAMRQELRTWGEQLGRKRRAAAAKIKPLIEAQLKDLAMPDAVFEVSLERLDPEDANVGPSGLDQIEMLVRANPGQPARPLRKVASGGELSRIMLAIKSILAASDRVSVLVFDEVDANIGGRLGTVIGRKLHDLANAAHGQVLCITHLPQIAALADRHLRIVKQVCGRGKTRRTTTAVTPVTGPARVEELAEMLAGSAATATTRKQVKEMLAGSV